MCSAQNTATKLTELPWWQTGVIYQIYPRSFYSAKNTATGDLKGITAKLNYLQDLGVSAIWITPIYVSPQVDNGYDVANYCQIDPMYGDFDDFNELVTQAHARSIKIIMDMVLNHTSTEHEWFVQGQHPDSPYHDFYIWHEGDRNTTLDGHPGLPNNWQSKFGGPAWRWNENAQKYFLKLFSDEQADLNWDNPQVRAEIFKICKFWSDLGIDGFRFDVINLVSKPGHFDNATTDDGRGFYTDGPRIHQYLAELSDNALRPYNLMSVGEMSSTSIPHCQSYAQLNGNELSMVFNFHHIKIDYPNGEKWALAEPNYVELKKIFADWQGAMHNQAWMALFWCNHDQPRIVSRFCTDPQYYTEAAKTFAMMLHGLQGTPYIFQGEEIGMTNPDFTHIEQYRDVETHNMYNLMLEQSVTEAQALQILAQKSRDNSRTPMQWDDSRNGGFSTSIPWIDVANNYTHINARQAIADSNSVYHTYKKLISLRKELEVITWGNYQDLDSQNPDLWIYTRNTEEQTLLVVANLRAYAQEINLAQYCAKFAPNQPFKVVLQNYREIDLDQLLHQQEVITLQPYQSFMLLAQ